MSELHFNGHKYTIPGRWNDLKPHQLVTIAGLLHSNMNVDEAKFRILMCLMEMKKRWYLSLRIMFMSWDEKADLLADFRLLAEFLFDDEKLDLTRQLLPSIKVPAGIKKSDMLYGPPDNCKKMVFMEFIKAETYYLKFRKNFTNLPARLEALDKLVAVLYRHKKKKIDFSSWDGDLREVYNDNTVVFRASRIVSKIPENVKYAILLFYISCRNVKINRYKHVFGNSGSGNGNWIDALRSMAGGAIHMQEMAMVDAEVALYDLDKIIEESQKNPRNK